MTRRSQRRGRPYQPYPVRKVNWGARLLVALVAVMMVVGIAVVTLSR
jgi:hypothetical protein